MDMDKENPQFVFEAERDKTDAFADDLKIRLLLHLEALQYIEDSSTGNWYAMEKNPNGKSRWTRL